MVQTVRRVCALAVTVWLSSTPAAVAQTARVTLLPAGQRASVVVELDDLVNGATAIEATDDRTVQVEIGPVRGKVLNQLLQAAANSPLVSQVRVRGVTRGAEGTIVTIQVVGKSPISGSVRRAARRIYIDLEPLEPLDPLELEPPRPAAAQGGRAPVIAASAPPPASPTTPPLAPAPTVQNGRSRAPVPVPAPVPTPAPASPAELPARSAPAAVVATAKPPAAAAPPRATAPVQASAERVAPTAGVSTVTPRSDVEALAERLARVPDVKGLEKLKADLLAKRKGPEIEGLVAKLDGYLLEAQRNRLAADAALFRTEVQTPPAPTGQLAAARALRPQLEQISRAVNDWNGGPAPQELITLSATLPKLRELHLPPKMTEAHSVLCNSLEGLATLWAQAAAEPIAPGTDLMPPAVGRARSALDSFLALERSLSAQPSAQ